MATVTLDGIDISAYVLSCDITVGFSAAMRHVADVGLCTLLLDNSDRRFSPGNTNSPIYGSLLPYKVVLVTEGGATLFRGFVSAIRPEAGQYGTKRCTIECVDMLGVLQNCLISLPMQQSKTPDELLRVITSAALRGALATGTVTLTGNPSDGDTLTIGSTTYTFKNTASTAYQVQIGANKSETAQNLEAAINAAGEEFVTNAYGTGTQRHAQVSASYQPITGAMGGTISIEPTTLLSASPIGNIGLIVRPSQQFVPTIGKLSSIQIYITTSSGSPGDVQWELRNDNSNLPGDLIQSGTFTPTPNSWNTITVTNGTMLYDTQKYWLQFRLVNEPWTTAYWLWKYGGDVYAGGISADWTNNNGGEWLSWPQYDYFLRVTTDAVSDPVVTLTAVARGAWANSINLATTSASITLSGATLSGGVDEPVGYIDFDTGRRTIDVAADTWGSERTNALTAIEEVAESEFGYFWCARNGTLTFRDQHWPFTLANTAADITLSDDHVFQDAALDSSRIINRVNVSYLPRGSTTSGIIARAQSVISVPGRGLVSSTSSNYARWNPADSMLQTEGSRTITLPYVDVTTGRIVGAQSLELPLVPGTDYTVYDTPDTTGFNYTYSKRVKFSLAITGSGIEVHMTNTAMGTLYVHNLQVRGTAYIAYDALQITKDDPVSQENYGKRAMTIDIPLQIDGGDAFAEQVASYVLSQYATPSFEVRSIGSYGLETLAGVDLYSLDIGDVISLSETQTGVSNQKCWIAGISYSLKRDAAAQIVFNVLPLDDKTYLTLDDDIYGLLDQNYLAL